MKTNIYLNVPGLLAFSTTAINGAHTLGATIGLLQNTEAAILADRTSLVTARNQHEEAKLELSTRRDALADKLDQALTHGTVIRDLLKPRFGAKYSNAYQAIGLQGSVSLPRNVAGLSPVLEAIKGFLENHAELQNEALNITPAYLTTLMGDLNTAQHAVVTQEGEVKRLIGVRNEAAVNLRDRLRGLASELSQLLDPMDVRWLSFGFNLPGAAQTPDQVEGVMATLIGPTAAAMKWNATARADYYRVWKKVVGVDADPIAVGSPADLDFTMEGLPTGATIEIYISAVNAGGEGPLSQKVTVTTHP